MRFHKGNDPWGRGSYEIPDHAVLGSSDCGTWSDSPAPSDVVQEELEAVQHYLEEHGIKSKLEYTDSGNAFMKKRWVVVSKLDYQRALPLAKTYLAEHQRDTRFIHDAT